MVTYKVPEGKIAYVKCVDDSANYSSPNVNLVKGRVYKTVKMYTLTDQWMVVVDGHAETPAGWRFVEATVPEVLDAIGRGHIKLEE